MAEVVMAKAVVAEAVMAEAVVATVTVTVTLKLVPTRRLPPHVSQPRHTIDQPRHTPSFWRTQRKGRAEVEATAAKAQAATAVMVRRPVVGGHPTRTPALDDAQRRSRGSASQMKASLSPTCPNLRPLFFIFGEAPRIGLGEDLGAWGNPP